MAHTYSSTIFQYFNHSFGLFSTKMTEYWGFLLSSPSIQPKCFKAETKNSCRTNCGSRSRREIASPFVYVFLSRWRSWRGVENRRPWQIHAETLSGTRKYGIGIGSERAACKQTAPSIQPREREMNLVTADHKVPQGFAHAASTLSSELERISWE